MPHSHLTADSHIATLNHAPQSVASIAARIRALVEAVGVPEAASRLSLTGHLVHRIAAVANAITYESAREADAADDPMAAPALAEARRATDAAINGPDGVRHDELHRAHEALDRLATSPPAVPAASPPPTPPTSPHAPAAAAMHALDPHGIGR